MSAADCHSRAGGAGASDAHACLALSHVCWSTPGGAGGVPPSACGPRKGLTTELPDLLAVLSVRLGPIDRVLYKLTDWAKAPTKFAAGRRAVKLDGYRLQPPNTVEVLGLNRSRIVLLVVPPHTDTDRAHATLMAAAAPDNDSTVDGLLMISLRDRESRTQRAAA